MNAWRRQGELSQCVSILEVDAVDWVAPWAGFLKEFRKESTEVCKPSPEDRVDQRGIILNFRKMWQVSPRVSPEDHLNSYPASFKPLLLAQVQRLWMQFDSGLEKLTHHTCSNKIMSIKSNVYCNLSSRKVSIVHLVCLFDFDAATVRVIQSILLLEWPTVDLSRALYTLQHTRNLQRWLISQDTEDKSSLSPDQLVTVRKNPPSRHSGESEHPGG